MLLRRRRQGRLLRRKRVRLSAFQDSFPGWSMFLLVLIVDLMVAMSLMSFVMLSY